MVNHMNINLNSQWWIKISNSISIRKLYPNNYYELLTTQNNNSYYMRQISLDLSRTKCSLE
jgi:hypothetical protein